MNNKECVHFKDCGACSFRLAFPKGQLKKKEEYLARLFEGRKLEPIEAMENPYHYRNKVLRTYKGLGKNKLISGIYEKGSHWVVPIDGCLIEDERAKRVQRTIYRLLSQAGLSAYDEDTGKGLIRHSLVRVAGSSGEISVTLVINGDRLPNEESFVKSLVRREPQVKAVYINSHRRKTPVVVEGRLRQVYGRAPIKDRLLGLDILLSGNSFYQVNHSQAEKLYSRVMELLDIKEGQVVLDAYCGIGVMALLAAKEGARVLGVENNPSALADAREMKRINRLSKVDFIEEDATKFIKELANSGTRIDKFILDPPRAGTTEDFIKASLELAPETIVYVSCNPARLKEELPLFEKAYKTQAIYPVDLFPFTRHVETVCLMSRKEK